MAIEDWSATPADNTELGGISTDGTVTLVKQLDNILRGMMAEVRVGIDGGQFENMQYSSKSGGYTAVLADRGKAFDFTAAATLALTAAATLTAGWWCRVKATGGAVIINPDSAELIDGVATVTILPGDGILIFCTGTAFLTFGIPAPRIDPRNRIVNGAMQHSQEFINTTTTVNADFPVDQFSVNFVTSAGTITSGRVQSVTPNGSKDRLRVTITAADASLAVGEFLFIRQPIEGNKVADFLYGAVGARQSILRFGFKAPAGTYAVALRNSASNRSYVQTFTITGGQANTDTEQTVIIPGDTSGTWLTDNGVGIYVTITLACGATFQGSTGWQAGNFFGTSGVSNGMGTINNVFELFDVGFYLDKDATGIPPKWELPDADFELMRCQRFYCKTFPQAVKPAQGQGLDGSVVSASYASGGILGVWKFPVTMRAAPSPVTTYNPVSANINWRDFTNSVDRALAASSNISDTHMEFRASASAAGVAFNYIQATANARL